MYIYQGCVFLFYQIFVFPEPKINVFGDGKWVKWLDFFLFPQMHKTQIDHFALQLPLSAFRDLFLKAAAIMTDLLCLVDKFSSSLCYV